MDHIIIILVVVLASESCGFCLRHNLIIALFGNRKKHKDKVSSTGYGLVLTFFLLNLSLVLFFLIILHTCVTFYVYITYVFGLYMSVHVWRLILEGLLCSDKALGSNEVLVFYHGFRVIWELLAKFQALWDFFGKYIS